MMADATKVPKWAMDCAKLLRQFYEPYRKFNACRGDYENVPDSDVAAIIAAAAPDIDAAIAEAVRATAGRCWQITMDALDESDSGDAREVLNDLQKQIRLEFFGGKYPDGSLVGINITSEGG